MVDDPSSCEDEYSTEEEQLAKRQELHDLIKKLVIWENSNDEALLVKARKEIAISVARSRRETAPETPQEVLHYLRDKAPTVYDPFCGGGSIPLEVQRLGLKAVGSDLNPIAVLITKALIELPPKFADQPPINPDADPLGFTTGKGRNKQRAPWHGTAGLAADIRYYGKWMREEAFKRIGHFYPQATLSDGSKATVIAWLWARTIPCPNPVCGIKMPMMKTFQLSKKRNNEHWVRPIIDRDAKLVSFAVQNHRTNVPEEGTRVGDGATCIACGSFVKLGYVRESGKAGKISHQMTAIVAEGDRKRLFVSSDDEHTLAAHQAIPDWKPKGSLPEKARSISIQIYGFTEWHQLFTDRQLKTLTTFVDLLDALRERLEAEGAKPEYIDAICTYVAFAVDKTAGSGSGFNVWQNSGDFVAQIFGRQGIGMIWDFAETNPFSTSTQNWLAQIEWIARAIEKLPADCNQGTAYQADATALNVATDGPIVVTDPPYYDNIHYADSSDFFYVWLRSQIRDQYPDLFASTLSPKNDEMVANRFRHSNAGEWFETQLLETLRLVKARCSDSYPSSIFYAYKQRETEVNGHISTGWEKMLNALIRSGFQITGTWPMRTERSTRLKDNANTLASSVVLVCRPRPVDVATCSRRQFLSELKQELPKTLDQLTHESHIAPTDLEQAAIGPGMEIYSRYSEVRTISGEPVTVREALQAISRTVIEYHERQEGEFDPESQFCLTWMKQHQFKEGKYGDAEVLSQAKNIDIAILADAHRLLTSGGGKVQLYPIDEFNPDRPYPNAPMTAWEGCMRIAYNMDGTRGDADATLGSAEVAHRMGSNAESVERLARVLYNYCDGRGEAGTALLFNELVRSWPEIQAKANEIVTARQTTF